jgi:hypothetical protein
MHEMATIYRKTAKGTTEIETRAHRLAPRLRSMLIVVDGKRSAADLRQMLSQQADETIAALLSGGFIEAVSAPPATAPRQEAPPVLRGLAPPAPHSTMAPSTTRPATLPPGTDFRTLRREVVHAMTDLVGPMAEALAIKMERSRNEGELAHHIETAAQIVANVRGEQAAAQFRRRFSGS